MSRVTLSGYLRGLGVGVGRVGYLLWLMQVAGFEHLLGRDRIVQKVAGVFDMTGDYVSHTTFAFYDAFEFQ